MRELLSLAGSLLRGGGRHTSLDLGLTVVGVAIPVAVILLVVGTVTGFREREDRMAWREPSPVSAESASALQRRSYQPWQGHRIDVVELKPLGEGPPAPPGMARPPEDGEIWISPALATRLEADSAVEILEERLNGHVVGELGRAALAYDDELVAVVGNPGLRTTPPGQRSEVDHRLVGTFVPSDVLPVSGFEEAGTDPGLPTQYRVAALIAGTLLVAPSVSLIGAAARLTASRRGRRLAALRLAGATSRQVTTLATIETGFAACLGVVLGAVTAMAATALVTAVPLAGGTFSFTDLLPSPGLWAAILFGSCFGAVISAVAGLRGVRATPLGVVRQGRKRRPTLRRLLVMVLAWMAFLASIPLAQETNQYWFLASGLMAVILSISAFGPLFVWLLGRVTSWLARRPRTLIAARRLMADPVSSFRPTTGLILVSFVAGFLLVSNLTLPRAGDGQDSVLLAHSETEASETMTEDWQRELAVEYPGVRFSADDPHEMVLPPGFELEAERSSIQQVTSHLPVTVDESRYEQLLFAEDVRRAMWIALAIALVQAAFATGVGAAASVLEQSTTLAALHLAGTPTSALHASRSIQAFLPTTLGAAVFVALGALAGTATIVGVRPGTLVVLPSVVQAALVVVAAGLAAVAGTGLASPVLKSVLQRPLAER